MVFHFISKEQSRKIEKLSGQSDPQLPVQHGHIQRHGAKESAARRLEEHRNDHAFEADI